MCGRDELPCSLFNRVCYGMGYDSATKEHKVVRLFYLHEEGQASAVTACEVFTIGQASAHWRPAAQRPPPCTISLFTVALALFFSGNLHFLQNQFKGDCIVTFNVSQETFGSLMPPPGLDHVDFELAVLDGCLCLHYGLDGYSPDPNFYIWRLTSYDGEGQWEQLFRIQPQAWPDAMPQIDFNRKHRIAPLEIYYGGDGHKKIMFSTDALTVFTVDVDLDGFGAPKVLFTPPMDSFAKTSFDTHAVGLLEESLVSVGRSSEEIIFSSPSMRAWSHILKWLPTHSVVPLMRVCKDWHAALKSHRFIQLHNAVHAKIGNTRPRISLIAPSCGLFLPLEECDSPEIEQINVFEFLFGRQSRVVCSKPCHDLVVGSYTNARGMSWDFICNPTMGYYKQVYLDPDGSDSFLDGRIGLGYDLRMNKHVLVRLVYHERNMNTREYHLGCYVRLMDTESWRPISLPPRPVAEMQSVYTNGKLYWMVDPNLGSKSWWECELLVLDINTQEFEVLEGPWCEYDQITSIVELQGNICVVCSDETMIDIWMLEGGVWSIWCTLDLGEFWRHYPPNETRILDVDPMDGRLILNTGKVLGYYDPMTMTIETIYCLIGRLNMKFAPVLSHQSLICPYIRIETSMYL
jgi:F-box interacting protein